MKSDVPGITAICYEGITDEGRIIRPAAPPLTTRSFPSTALSARQRQFYYCRVAVWRPSNTVSALGKPVDPTYSILYDYLPCYLRQGESNFAPAGGLLVENDNLFTLDEFHHHSSADLKTADVLQLLVGPTNEVGRWFMVRGDQKISDWRAHKAVVGAAKLPHKPGGIP